MKELVLSSLRKRKVQTVSMVLVIVASVALLFALALMYAGMSQGVALSKERGGAQVLVVPADAAAEVSDSELLFTGSPSPMYVSVDIADKIAVMDGVKRVSTQFFSQTISASCCDTGTETRIVGFDTGKDWTVQPLTDYDLSQGLADDQVLLGSRFDENTGDTIVLLGKTYRIAGRLAATGSDIDQCIMVDIDVARSMSKGLTGYGHYWKKYGSPEDLVSDILVDLDDDIDDSARTLVMRRIGNIEGVRAIERSAIVDSSAQSLSGVFGVTLAAGAVMLVVCVLQLFARFYTMAWDRKSELALYRAVGATKGQVAKLIGSEALVLTGAGVVVGLACGGALYALGRAWLSGIAAFPFVAPSPFAIAACAVGFVVVFALLAAASIAAPLHQIGRIDPSAAMQQSDIG